MAARAKQTIGVSTERAVQVQWLTPGGMDVQQIANLLGCSPATVSRYRAYINGALAMLWPVAELEPMPQYTTGGS